MKGSILVKKEYAFCLNSHRWLVFMDSFGNYPKTCPNKGQCCESIGSRCEYLEEREPTEYLLDKIRKIKAIFK